MCYVLIIAKNNNSQLYHMWYFIQNSSKFMVLELHWYDGQLKWMLPLLADGSAGGTKFFCPSEKILLISMDAVTLYDWNLMGIFAQ